ncbi:DUF5994 family protein [Streptomyces sp. NPDC057460]|uniref:DUF5994 family protein n=1 Tax=Streptomyces sp. NPDC057460 TaxID=3346141 RepID=UPI00368C1334
MFLDDAVGVVQHPVALLKIPRKVPVQGHVVHVGWFKPEQDPNKLLLLSYATRRWDLLVIPPQTDPGTAARLLTAAADPARRLTASGLMREAELFRVAAEADWDLVVAAFPRHSVPTCPC